MYEPFTVLKPCPFCGNRELELLSQAELWDDDDLPVDRFTVVCPFPVGCGATCGFQGNKEKAIKAWNRRAEGDV